ncbi:hypothetical protein E6H14_07760 [Candidatus Bathyarchaeota archaeon]|nr:MAG: hypothetical protein E6H14_07760 [Candidatus Bathyarchaeota archaeon]
MKPRKAKQRIAGKKVFDAKKRSETEGVKQVKYSKRLHAGISKRLLPESEISPWHRTAVIMKNGILLEVPVRPLSETRGMIPGLNNKGLRDKGDRMSSTGMGTKKLAGNKNRPGGSRVKKTSKQAVAGDLLDYIRTIAPDEELASALERVLEKRKLIKIGADRWED